MRAAPRPATTRLVAMRWWHIEQIMPLEDELFGAERWSAGMFWAELAEVETRFYLVAVQGEDVVGYGGLCVYGGQAAEAYVQTLGVRGDHQRRGVGGALLSALVGEAERRGAGTLALEVRADNESAQRLYARHGFEPVALRRGYYQPSNTDAVVMVRHVR